MNLLHVFNNLGTPIGLTANGYLWSWGLKEEYEQMDWYTVYSSELPEWKKYYYGKYNNGFNRSIKTPSIHPTKSARIILNQSQKRTNN